MEFGGRIIDTAGDGILAEFPSVVNALECAVAAASGRFDQASRHLSAALAEWRGPVLEDLRDFQFVEAFATALVEDKIVVHTAKAEAEIACGRAAAVISELEALTTEHPYREPLWAQLITAYYLTDRQSDALAAYRRVKTVLADDLGIDPGQTLRDLNDRFCDRNRWTPRKLPRPPRSARSPCSISAPASPARR